MALRRCLTWGGAVLMAAPLLLASPAPAAGQAAGAGDGRGIYLRECASCHGDAATGYGAARWLLREQPPDLTMLSGRDRRFDGGRVRDIVTGHVRRVPPQWPSEMPYWRRMPASELASLVTYLESVQRVPYGPYKGLTIAEQAKLGAPLFKANCMSCHGIDGRGSRPSGLVIGAAIPDLTTIALRQGGTVDMRALYEAIARCGADEGTMPAWQRVLRRRGWPTYLVMKDLEHLAWYVESLQQR